MILLVRAERHEKLIRNENGETFYHVEKGESEINIFSIILALRTEGGRPGAEIR